MFCQSIRKEFPKLNPPFIVGFMYQDSWACAGYVDDTEFGLEGFTETFK